MYRQIKNEKESHLKCKNVAIGQHGRGIHSYSNMRKFKCQLQTLRKSSLTELEVGMNIHTCHMQVYTRQSEIGWY